MSISPLHESLLRYLVERQSGPELNTVTLDEAARELGLGMDQVRAIVAELRERRLITVMDHGHRNPFLFITTGGRLHVEGCTPK